MATTKELFSQAITKGMDAAKSITDPFNRATAYAQLAQAMSRVISLQLEVLESKIEDTPSLNKESLKPAKSTKAKTSAPKDEPVKEEVKDDPEPETTDKWTEENIKLKQEQLNNMKGYVESYGVEAINECLEQFSQGLMKDYEEDITPLNIDAFLAFLDQLAENE